MPTPDEGMSVDLGNYKDRVGQRVDEGRYNVVVDDAELDKSNAGNPMFNVWLRILDGEFQDSVVMDRLVNTEKSLFRIVGFMQAVGLPTPKKRINLRRSQIVGQRLMIDVADGEPYMGRVKSEVRGYIAMPRSRRAQQQEADLDADDNDSQPGPDAMDTESERTLAAVPATGGSSGLDEFAQSDADVDLDDLEI